MKKTIIILLLLTTSIALSSFIAVPIEDEIDEAELIIQGRLIEKTEKTERLPRYLTNKDGEVKFIVDESIFTTFTFSVDKVLKGRYKGKQINVKMIGGCDLEKGYCDKYSFNYDYDESERGVLFLRYSEQNSSYQMTQGSSTAYAVDENNNLINKSNGQDNEEEDKFYYHSLNAKDEMIIKEGLSIETLNNMIRSLQNEN